VNTPVVVVVFNRPEKTRVLLEVLAEVKPSVMFVVGDGPRRAIASDGIKVEAVRKLLMKPSWKCEMVRDYSDENLGCARRVSSGLANVFSQIDEAIILEDDCIPDPSFFRFCEELLDRYRDDSRVGSICGTDFTCGEVEGPGSYYFSRYNLFWGWATWRRAWRFYDHSMKVVQSGELWGVLCRVFPDFRARVYWWYVLKKVYRGSLDSWGYRWMLSCWVHGMLGILSRTSLIKNIGFGAEATHTKGTGIISERCSCRFPLEHPDAVIRDSACDRAIEEIWYSKSLRRRLRRFLGKSSI